jgi:hypothetical protein
MKTFDKLIDFLLFFYGVLDDFILKLKMPIAITVEYEELLF